MSSPQRPLDLSTVGPGVTHVEQSLHDLCNLLEVEHATYASQLPQNGALIGLTTYPPSWRAHYVAQGYHLLDPTLTKAIHAVAPVDWSRLSEFAGYHEIFNDARDFALPEHGLSVPIRGAFGDRGVLTIAQSGTDGAWAKQKAAIITRVQELGAQLHREVMFSGQAVQDIGPASVSAREVEILQWVAIGKSQQDIADILSISHRTVEVHLRSVREKLGTTTTAHAVARAVSKRLIYAY